MADTSIDAMKFLRALAIAANTDLSTRVYMSFAPQNAVYPLAIMDIVSRVESPTQDVGSAIDTYRIQVDVFAKSTDGGYDRVSEIADELRQAWSRQGDDSTYDNIIDSVQEVGFRTDFDPELRVFSMSSDYFIRVGAGSMGVQHYSTAEQQYRGQRWINDAPIFWRTWSLGTGNDSYEDLTGLLIADVALIIPTSTHISTVTLTGEWQVGGVLLEESGTVYKVYTHSGTSENYVTLYYTKN